jgi:lipoyl(octanoyl) transferase
MADHGEELWVARLGTVPYAEAAALQEGLRAARQRGAIPDVLLVLEHWPVYTKGRRTDPAELGMGEDWYRMQGIEVIETDRGGRVTYHGPGQLVAYPIVDLAGYGDDVHAYVRRLERVMIEALAAHDVPAQVFDGLTGVWTAGQPPVPSGELGPQGTPVGAAAEPGDGEPARKIGSIGVHVSRGVTKHGLAINVNNDLQPFEWVVPCGIEAARPTSLAREHGAEQDLGAFATTVVDRFGEIFERRPRAVDAQTTIGAISVSASRRASASTETSTTPSGISR